MQKVQTDDNNRKVTLLATTLEDLQYRSKSAQENVQAAMDLILDSHGSMTECDLLQVLSTLRLAVTEIDDVAARAQGLALPRPGATGPLPPNVVDLASRRAALRGGAA